MASLPHHRPRPPLLARDCALFLDVDGTLMGFHADPSAAALPEGSLAVIEHLSGRLHGALALVSGRPLSDLDRIFAPLRLPAAGQHGQEFRDMPVVPAGVPAALGPLHRQAQVLSHRYPGVVVEHKTAGLALHWRAAPRAQAALQALASEYLPQLPGYRLQPGDHVIELVPAHADKGRAVEHLLASAPFAGRVPVFAGDDLTDEYGFAAANARRGWSVLVGQRRTSHAIYGLDDVAAVHSWLRTSLDAMEDT